MTSAAWPVKGALSITMRSRCGTWVFQSPPSRASFHTKVAGSFSRHWKSRGPVGTPQMGTRSARGREAK